ncbi:hypothetical protein [Bradyrhizobium sp. AT1]|uniref:hypothetical protein n=1 Tax=Bradyrhizobium sp. AT1 TaxID=574934 RepID=UPI0018DC69B4|nr:hypothetical protein [Bradyrhizobium sp. AT1]
MSSLQLNVVRQQMGVGCVPGSAGVETTQCAALDPRPSVRVVRSIVASIASIALLPLLGRE